MIISDYPAPAAESKELLHPEFASGMAYFIEAAIESAGNVPSGPGLSMLHQWSVQELRRLVFTDEPNIDELCEFLAKRWQIIAAFPELHYCIAPENKVNQACLALAEYLEKITGRSRYQLLMPTLTVTTNEITSTELTENILELQQFILSNDRKHFIEILYCLDNAREDGVLKHTSLYDGLVKPLSEQEIKILTRHSPAAAKYWQAICEKKEAEEKSESFGANLKRLMSQLRKGGVHNAENIEEKSQAGTELVSGADANAGVTEFSEWLNALDEDEKNQLMQLTAPGLTVPSENVNRPANFADIWGRILNPVYQYDAQTDSYVIRDTRFCVEILEGNVERIYSHNKTWLDATFPKNAKKANKYYMEVLEQDIADKRTALQKTMDDRNFIFYAALKKDAFRNDGLLLEKLFETIDPNPVLGILMAQNPDDIIEWLANEPEVREKINQEGMQSIADFLAGCEEGRELLWRDERLQSLCPEMISGKPLADWMKQARDEVGEEEKSIGLFAANNPMVKQFLQYIVYGDQANAEKMLQEHPDQRRELLTVKMKVKDYSGRKIDGTALRIAMGAEDVGYQKDEECMVEMLQKYLQELPDGEELMAAQIAKQFPEGWEAEENERAERDKLALETVINAIAESKEDADCEAALQTFRNYLEPKGTIRTGRHFNTRLLLDAFELYDKNYDAFDGWDSRKNNICWRKVIGYIQRFLPACYAQAFSNSLYDIVDEGRKLERTFKFRYGGGSFYPLDSDLRFRLGYDYAGRGRDAVWVHASWCPAAHRLGKIMSNKNKKLGELMLHARKNTASSRCLIC